MSTDAVALNEETECSSLYFNRPLPPVSQVVIVATVATMFLQEIGRVDFSTCLVALLFSQMDGTI